MKRLRLRRGQRVLVGLLDRLTGRCLAAKKAKVAEELSEMLQSKNEQITRPNLAFFAFNNGDGRYKTTAHLGTFTQRLLSPLEPEFSGR
ncbi:MAG: hypothetical protein C5B49_08120 [Bdellovibrio sp.]|nr:MAG: hypothetical protein C5B49_08120 [Bdellovibrio sp.]